MVNLGQIPRVNVTADIASLISVPGNGQVTIFWDEQALMLKMMKSDGSVVVLVDLS